MQPTDRYPWTYRDQPASGGLMRPRPTPTPNHPTHRGRVYVIGSGWHWLAGWAQADGSIRLALDPMSPGQVDQYCRPSSSPSSPSSTPAAPATRDAFELAPPTHAATPSPGGARERTPGPPARAHTVMPYANRSGKSATLSDGRKVGEGISEEDLDDDIPF